MRINSNAQTQSILRKLNESKKKMQESMERLASGQKINRASDDPAGLVISEQLRSRIAAIEQEVENLDARDHKLNTADGHLSTLQGNLQEMRRTALAAANDGLNSEDARKAYQNNMDASVSAYNKVCESALYGSQRLFDGGPGSVASLTEMAGLNISSAEKAQQAVETIDQKINEISNSRVQIGSTQKNEIAAARNNLQTELINLTAAESTVRDTDMAREYVDFVISQIQLKVGIAMLAQQRQVPNLVLNFLQE